MNIAYALLITIAALVFILFIMAIALLFKGANSFGNYKLDSDIGNIKHQLNDVFED